MADLKAYKLTTEGEALLVAAKREKNPVKGIVNTKGGVRVNIKTLTDETAKLIEHTPYVEKVDKKS